MKERKWINLLLPKLFVFVEDDNSQNNGGAQLWAPTMKLELFQRISTSIHFNIFHYFLANNNITY